MYKPDSEPKRRIHDGNLLTFLRDAAEPNGADAYDCDPVAGYISEVHVIQGPMKAAHATRLARIQENATARQERQEGEFREEFGNVRGQRRAEGKEQADVDGELYVRMVTALNQANAWLGVDGHLSVTHKSDDWTKGSDLILTLPGPNGQPVRLAIDMTVAKSDDVVNKKLDRIFETIKDGKMTTVEYFEDPETHQKEKLEMIPRVVVPIGEEGLQKLRDITAQFFSGEKRVWGEETGFPKAFLDTIIGELEGFIHVLERAAAAKTLPDKAMKNKDHMIEKMRVILAPLRELRNSKDITKLGRWELDERQLYVLDYVQGLAA
ncbi:hypothetical protein HY624_01365 [Candidatus Uhrbacteria bacterium]|nr:hypothetical protein [Candidatus Uhrbacteria bacterium]